MERACTVSRATGSPEQSTRSAIRGEPDFGPLPSRPIVPSITANAGRMTAFKSAMASSRTRCHSCRVLGRHPHWFFNDPVRPVLAWVFITGTVMRTVSLRIWGTSILFRTTFRGASIGTEPMFPMLTHWAPVRRQTSSIRLIRHAFSMSSRT